MVAAAAMPKIRAATPRKAASAPWRAQATSARAVFIVPPPPGARLIASLGRAVQPLVHAPQAVQASREGRIGVVEAAVVEGKRAHAGSLPGVGGHIGSRHCGML